MRKQSMIGLLAMLALFVSTFFLAGCFGPTKVTTVTVQEKEMPVKVDNDASIAALNKVTVNPTVSGNITNMAVKVGDTVQQGQVIAQVDTAQLQQQLEALLQQLSSAQAQTTVVATPAQTTVVPGAVSSADVERARQMLNNGIITEKEFQTIQARSQASTVTTGGGYVTTGSGSGANVAALQAQIAQVQAQIAQSQIVAPIAGTITQIYNADRKVAVAGRPFAMIQQLSPVVASLSIPQSFAKALASPEAKKNMKVYLKVDKKDYPGQLTYVDTTSPAGTPAVLLKATFNNPGNVIKIGESYTLVIETGVKAPALVIPKDAVHENKDGKFVYVVTADNTVDVRVVDVGEDVDGYVTVMNGLKKGEQIITSKGSFELGESVKVE